MNNPAISVVCTAYNHKQYIENCLRGFVLQKTTFPFEVLVHDDASTDGTTDIIRRYARLYPDIIRPIIQTENQYSKGAKILAPIIKNNCTGKYIAFCEGDDYWIDPYKLQTQYDFLESHQDYSLCLHNAIVTDLSLGVDYLTEPDSGNREKPMEQLIMEGGGAINPTGSFLFRKDCMPPWTVYGPVGDHFYMIRLGSMGKVYWMSKPMSVYRFGSSGSFSEGYAGQQNEESIKRFCLSYCRALEICDEQTIGLYHDAFVQRMNLQKTSAARDLLRLGLSDSEDSEVASWIRGLSLADRIFGKAVSRIPAPILVKLKRLKRIAKAKSAGTLVSTSNRGYLKCQTNR